MFQLEVEFHTHQQFTEREGHRKKDTVFPGLQAFAFCLEILKNNTGLAKQW